MNLIENIKEGIRSINANMLRSILTALIVAIGIASLVGILTAIDGIEASITDSFSSLGANSFNISVRRPQGSFGGRRGKVYPPITYKQATLFEQKYGDKGQVSLSTFVTQIAEVKRLSEKTNPNVSVVGGNENYIYQEGLDIEKGRNFSAIEVEHGTNVAVVGPEITNTLFKDDEDPLNQEISVWGTRFRIVGVLSKQGAMDGGSSDKRVIIPLNSARALAAGQNLTIDIDVLINNSFSMDQAMGEAKGIMRIIRHDRIGDEESFLVERSESLAETLGQISGYLKIGGFGIGIITLLGASIGLMNIMMVSVTERTREIGVRKALGATPARIRQQFLIEAVVICQMGGIAGIILGMALGNLVTTLIGDDISFVVPWLWILISFVIGVIVGVGSGYYPANKASKLDPIESLRFE
ncbi:MAG: ABC transporter permease [Cyclobacteriaceae bacterium]|nr:ABC transporter permease [Cyclobacteriaceae bacterium]